MDQEACQAVLAVRHQVVREAYQVVLAVRHQEVREALAEHRVALAARASVDPAVWVGKPLFPSRLLCLILPKEPSEKVTTKRDLTIFVLTIFAMKKRPRISRTS